MRPAPPCQGRGERTPPSHPPQAVRPALPMFRPALTRACNTTGPTGPAALWVGDPPTSLPACPPLSRCSARARGAGPKGSCPDDPREDTRPMTKLTKAQRQARAEIPAA